MQRLREFPTKATQRMQLFMQNRVVTRALEEDAVFTAPLGVRLIARMPVLSCIPARLLGLGVRPEHVATREMKND